MSRKRIQVVLSVAMLVGATSIGHAQQTRNGVVHSDPIINEFVFDHTGADDTEYVEVMGDANTAYTNFAILAIEGDSSKGVIDSVVQVGVTDSNGLFVTGFLTGEYENGSQTLLLVEGFGGSRGVDIDTNDTGTINNPQWIRVVDDVAVDDGDSGDLTYASVVLTNGFDGLALRVGGASRIPSGTDTDSVSDWMRNDFDLAPIEAGSPDVGEALNTPGAPNEAVPAPESKPGSGVFIM